MHKKEWFLFAVLFLYGSVTFIVSLQAAWGFTTDDAFISWFYARHLTEGQGLVWHSDLPLVEGYSNFLWVLLSAFILYFQWPLIASMKWISLWSVLVGFVFLYRLGRYFLNPVLALLPVFLFSQCVGTVWWTVSGLESAFFFALVMICFEQCVRAVLKHSLFSWGVCNLCLLLLSLTRFEGFIWAIPVLLFLCCYRWHERFLGSPTQLKRWLGVSFCCFFLPYAIYFAWHFYYFKEWIPNSYRCKALAQGHWGVVVLDYLKVIMPLFMAAVPFFVLAKKKCEAVLLALPSLLYALLLWQADSVIAHFLRLFLAPFALFLVLPVLGANAFLALFLKRPQSLTFGVTGVVLILSFWSVPHFTPAQFKGMEADYQDRSQNRLAIANLLNKKASLHAKVLVGDCGMIPFYARADLRFIDALCLNNYELSHAPYAGNLADYIAHVLKDIQPEWIIVNSALFSLPHTFENILQQQQFLAHYELFSQYESGVVWPGKSQKTISYSYGVYKRIPSSIKKRGT